MRKILVTLLNLMVITVNIYAQELEFSKPNDQIAEISSKVLHDAYRLIGIQIRNRTLPAERALLTSNRGKVDGEVNRVKGIERSYSNLIRVPVEINMLEGVVFTKDISFSVEGWGSLKPYKIGIRIGTKFAERSTKGMNVDMVTQNVQLFRKLNRGRYDIIVTSRLDGLYLLKKLQLKGIHVLEPPLVTLKLYHYLHKKHTSIIPDITKVLQEMEASGRIQEIRKQEIKKLLE